jgi:HSP20 family molecular chaperone IbpA
MALIRHSFLPRSMFDMDSWFRPTLDLFDPFDEIDHMLGRNLEWLTIPSMLQVRQPKVPRKYRVSLNCAGYNPKSIKTEVKDGKLYINGKEEIKDENGDFSTKEFRKTYELPENAEIDKLVSFVTRQGQLVVEVPLKIEEKALEDDLFPKIVDSKDGGKQVTMRCSVPNNIDPSKLTVTCKDRDIIIKAEDVQESEDNYSKKYYYKRCTMPENTDFNALKCNFENNSLTIEAPVNPELEKPHQIPIEFRNNKL